MCGITGYKGKRNASEIVIKGLKKLEYRGYDSWGIAIKTDNHLNVIKRIGKIGDVSSKELKLNKSSFGIAHTRWATTGKVTQENAHPHLSMDNKIAVVHNGIIENYQELKKFLTKQGFKFRSETDTEVIPQFIQYFMDKGNSFNDAVINTIKKLEGRFAIVAINKDYDTMIGARRGSPLVLGVGKDEFFLASDIPAFLEYTKDVIFLDDNEIVFINSKTEIRNFQTNKKVEKKTEKIDWDAKEAEKGSFPHFMLKEILEQKESIARAVNQDLDEIKRIAKLINDAFGVFIVGCGTAGKVCHTATYLFSRIADKHVNFSFSSEFPNYQHFLTDKTLMIAVSQSGETADTLEAIEAAKKKGVKVLSIVNVYGSSMTRISDYNIYVKSGPEKCVASTKVTTGQLAILTMLAYACAGKLEEGTKLIKQTITDINKTINDSYLKKIKSLAEKIRDNESMYIIGRGLNYPIALESAIKLQEVSYIHAEGFAGGELKHGPLALIDNKTPCIALVANDETKADILSNAEEVKSRAGLIIGVAPENNPAFDYWLEVPDSGNCSPIVNIIPVQLLAYYLSTLKGIDPDYPKNLAKCVSVK